MSRNGLSIVISLIRAVAPRKRRVSRNFWKRLRKKQDIVAPRKRRVSRNVPVRCRDGTERVAPRKRRVSRNPAALLHSAGTAVAPRKRRVSRNLGLDRLTVLFVCRASQEACE